MTEYKIRLKIKYFQTCVCLASCLSSFSVFLGGVVKWRGVMGVVVFTTFLSASPSQDSSSGQCAGGFEPDCLQRSPQMDPVIKTRRTPIVAVLIRCCSATN